MSMIPAPRRQRQEDHNFEALLAIFALKNESGNILLLMAEVNTELLQLMLLLGE